MSSFLLDASTKEVFKFQKRLTSNNVFLHQRPYVHNSLRRISLYLSKSITLIALKASSLYHHFQPLYLLLLCTFWNVSKSQTIECHFEKQPPVYLESEQLIIGDESISILNMVQDSSGIIWVASNNGLYKYDGRVAEHISGKLGNDTGLEGSYVGCIGTDKYGNVWVSSTENGLQKYNPSTKKFTSYKHAVKKHANRAKSKYPYFFSVRQGPVDRLWFTGPAGTMYYDQKTDSVYAFSNLQCPGILHVSENSVYLLTSIDIRVLDVKSGATLRIIPFNHYNAYSDGPGYCHIGHDEMLLTKKKTLWKYNLKTDSLIQIYDFGEEYVNSVVNCGSFISILTNKERLFKYYPAVDKMEFLIRSNKLDVKTSLATTRPALFTYDGVLIYGFLGAKLSKVHFVNGIEKYSRKGGRPAYANKVNYLKQNRNIYFFSNNGLVPIIPDVEIVSFPDFGFSINSRFNDGLNQYYQAVNGYQWYAYDGGIAGTYKLFVKNPEIAKPQLLSFGERAQNDHIVYIGPSNNGGVEVGFNSLKILEFDEYGQHPKVLYHDTTVVHNVGHMLRDDRDRLWCLTNNDGLILLNRNFERKYYKASKDDNSTINSDRVNDIFEDSNGNIWLVTENGLARYREDSEDFERIMPSCLPKPEIVGITEDDDGLLWMSGFTYIFSFDPKSYQCTIYTKQDGAGGGFYRNRQAGKIDQNRIFFAGIKFVTIIDPTTLKKTTSTGKLSFLELKLFNRIVKENDGTEILNKSIHTASEINLQHDQNILDFKISIPSYKYSKSTKYAYKINGFNSDWQHIGNKNEFTVMNLSPGIYGLEIRTVENGEVVAASAATLNLIVKPPWYWSLWAKLFYLVIAIASIYAFYRFLLNRQHEKQESLRLQELDELKTQLYTNVTHEFRSPLTVILGMADKIKDYFDLGDEIKFTEGQRLIRRNGKRLLDLVNQMLDLSKVDAGHSLINYQQQDAIQYINYIVESFHSLASDKGIVLNTNHEIDELIMDFDEDVAQKILSNLLSNAIKFSHANDEIHIDTSRKENQLIIEIKDFGQGIPAEDQPHVFDRFYQVDKVSRAGTGVGLALTQELVHQLQGQIRVESNPNHGSTFFVSLPISNRTPLAKHQTRTLQAQSLSTGVTLSEGSKDQPLILVIEDNREVAFYIGQCLESQYQLIYAEDGQAGIEKAIELIPDFIVSDVMMPRKSGYEVTAELKNDIRTSHIPIILLTARAGEEAKIEGLKMGADAYLTKPFNKLELLVRIEQLIELRQKLRSKYSSFEFDQALAAPEVQKEDAFILKLRDLINENLVADLSVTDLCQKIGMSRTQLHRKLAALTDQSTTQFIRAVRFEKAKELLRTSDLNIAEIAYETGFRTPAYFSRMFLKEVGVRPSEYRESLP